MRYGCSVNQVLDLVFDSRNTRHRVHATVPCRCAPESQSLLAAYAGLLTTSPNASANNWLDPRSTSYPPAKGDHGADRFHSVAHLCDGKMRTSHYTGGGHSLLGCMFGVWKSCKMLCLVCLLAARAQAQPVPKLFVDLTYDVDSALEGCPSAIEFRTLVAQQLGYDPCRVDSTVGLAVHVRPTETGIEGAIDWSTAAGKRLGERRFASRSDDCREMMTTVGFVVAVQIQLMASEQATEPTAPIDAGSSGRSGLPADLVPGEVTVTLSVKTFDVRAPPLSNQTNWMTMVGAGPSIGFGPGPGAVAQGRLFLAVQRAWAELEVGAEASLPSTKREDYGGGFRHELLLGTLAACGWYRSFSACGLGKLGRLQVHGVGVDKPTSSGGLVGQIGPRFAYSLGLGGHFILLGHVDGLYLVTPWTVDLNNVAVWTMPRFNAVAGIDLAIRF